MFKSPPARGGLRATSVSPIAVSAASNMQKERAKHAELSESAVLRSRASLRHLPMMWIRQGAPGGLFCRRVGHPLMM